LTSPRPYVAAAAAAVLAALYFVPSATASPAHPAGARQATARQPAQPAPREGSLADTGAIDTKPYVVGGSAFLVAGAGLVVNAGRRARRNAGEPATAVTAVTGGTAATAVTRVTPAGP
jgi:hypothetical protein